jgi:phosphoenolpyruvate-protein kinase (PTS system EI component)
MLVPIMQSVGGMRHFHEDATGRTGASEAAIFEAHQLFLQDPTLLEAARAHIFAAQLNAEAAWQQAFDVHYANPANGGYFLTASDADGLVGQLMQRAKWPVVTETTATWRDSYSSAVLVTNDVVGFRDFVNPGRPKNTRSIKYFVVYFTATK